MARFKCKECGKTTEANSKVCALCGGEMVAAMSPKRTKRKGTPTERRMFSGDSDLGRESPGDFTPVAVRAIKPKVPNRTVLEIGKQDKHNKSYKLKTIVGVIVTIIIAASLAFSIRYFLSDYNVKFSDENVEKRQTEQAFD